MNLTSKDDPKDAHECVSLNRVPFQNDENISPHPTATDWLFASLHSPLPGRGRGLVVAVASSANQRRL